MEGLLRGPLLVTAYRMVFLSPTAASNETSDGRSTRSGNAALHGMTAVNEASICYVAAQVRATLSYYDQTPDSLCPDLAFLCSVIQIDLHKAPGQPSCRVL